MIYSLTRDQLLEFAKIVYEESAHGYSDLKESACERLLSNFLLDKKTSLSNTHLSLTTNSVTTSDIFMNDVFTIADGLNINHNNR